MAHHNHNNSHSPERNFNSAFIIGILLNVIYIIVEVVYGVIINSMALLADAGHNFSDVLGLLLAWGAAYLAKTATTEKRTYGLRKSTILAALFNAIILMIAVGAISIEAIRKLIYPEPVQGSTMMIVAGIGFVINAITALLFMKGREKDLNIKGAFLHMAADAGVSRLFPGHHLCRRPQPARRDLYGLYDPRFGLRPARRALGQQPGHGGNPCAAPRGGATAWLRQLRRVVIGHQNGVQPGSGHAVSRRSGTLFAAAGTQRPPGCRVVCP